MVRLTICWDRNNFIVGQVTPDMLQGITYGTYILFGLLTYLGAAFIWFFVPETKRLTLEEMVSFTRCFIEHCLIGVAF